MPKGLFLKDGATLMVFGLSGYVQNRKQAQMEFCGLIWVFYGYFVGKKFKSKQWT